MKMNFKSHKILPVEESTNLQKIMEDFCRAKMAIYQYDDKTYQEKVSNFYKNVRSISFVKRTSIKKGSFIRHNGRIIISTPVENENELLSTIIHELNHAWNYEKGKRLGIISSPFTYRKVSKKISILEAVNEAETQILISSVLKNDKNQEFSGYPELEESAFQSLCVVCNQTGIDFLKSIEGMTEKEIIEHISKRSGYSIEESKKYFEDIAFSNNSVFKCLTEFEMHWKLIIIAEIKKYEEEILFNNNRINEIFERLSVLTKELDELYDKQIDEELSEEGEQALRAEVKAKRTERKNLEEDRDRLAQKEQNIREEAIEKIRQLIDFKKYFGEYQRIYEINKKFIENSQYTEEEKRVLLLKLEAMQDRISHKIFEMLNMDYNAAGIKIINHEEYDIEDPDAIFEFGRLNSEELFFEASFEQPWAIEEENDGKNKVQESLRKSRLFSGVRMSVVNMIRNKLLRDIERGDENDR